MDDVSTLLKKHKLSHKENLIRNAMRQGVCFSSKEPSRAPISNGESKIGGFPDLRSISDWPITDGIPLSFLCQINLSNLPSEFVNEQIPRTGNLLFFYDFINGGWGYDPKHRGHSAVVYLAESSKLTRPEESPIGITRSHWFGLIKRQLNPTTFSECSLTPKMVITLPDTGDPTSSILELTPEEADLYYSLKEDWDGLQGNSLHMLMGHPNMIQGEMQLECELVTNGIYCGDGKAYASDDAKRLQATSREWVLLMQISDDENADIHFGDVASLYFWIRQSDLVKGDFSKTWAILQTT